MDKELAQKIINDFKDLLYINLAIEKNNAKPYHFFDYLEKDEELKKEYNKIDKFSYKYREEKIAHLVYEEGYSKAILAEMIKANNPKKYTPKLVIESEFNFENLSDDELEKRIKELEDKQKNN